MSLEKRGPGRSGEFHAHKGKLYWYEGPHVEMEWDVEGGEILHRKRGSATARLEEMTTTKRLGFNSERGDGGKSSGKDDQVGGRKGGRKI